MDVTSEGMKFINELDAFGRVARKWLVKRDESTSEMYGQLPKNRSIKELLTYGMVCVDKPPGPTSHEVVAWVKKLLGVPKAGHGGTLEPCLKLGRVGIP